MWPTTYGPIIWGKYYNISHNEQLEKIQNNMLLFIYSKSNLRVYFGYDDILNLLNLKSLKFRKKSLYNFLIQTS